LPFYTFLWTFCPFYDIAPLSPLTGQLAVDWGMPDSSPEMLEDNMMRYH
jgi:hypothetical protein